MKDTVFWGGGKRWWVCRCQFLGIGKRVQARLRFAPLVPAPVFLRHVGVSPLGIGKRVQARLRFAPLEPAPVFLRHVGASCGRESRYSHVFAALRLWQSLFSRLRQPPFSSSRSDPIKVFEENINADGDENKSSQDFYSAAKTCSQPTAYQHSGRCQRGRHQSNYGYRIPNLNV